MNIVKWKIIKFPTKVENRGNLSFIEGKKHIPFEIKRVHFIYDVPSGATRGGHAHIKTESVIIALSGSFDVKVDDGFKQKTFFLEGPDYGMYLPPHIWKEIENFSANSVALVLTSTFYDEGDYIRDYALFKKMARQNKTW